MSFNNHCPIKKEGLMYLRDTCTLLQILALWTAAQDQIRQGAYRYVIRSFLISLIYCAHCFLFFLPISVIMFPGTSTLVHSFPCYISCLFRRPFPTSFYNPLFFFSLPKLLVFLSFIFLSVPSFSLPFLFSCAPLFLPTFSFFLLRFFPCLSLLFSFFLSLPLPFLSFCPLHFPFLFLFLVIFPSCCLFFSCSIPCTLFSLSGFSFAI